MSQASLEDIRQKMKVEICNDSGLQRLEIEKQVVGISWLVAV